MADAQRGGDRIDGESDIGEHDRDQAEEHRGEFAPAVMHDDQASFLVIAHGQPTLEEADQPARSGPLLALGARGLQGEYQQQRPKRIADEMGCLKQCDADEDRGNAQPEGGKGTPRDEVLTLRKRNLEGADEDRKDEHVVQGERPLDQVDGGIGARGL